MLSLPTSTGSCFGSFLHGNTSDWGALSDFALKYDDVLDDWVITVGSATASGKRSWESYAKSYLAWTENYNIDGYIYSRDKAFFAYTTIDSGNYQDEWSSESQYIDAWVLTDGMMTGTGSTHYKTINQEDHDSVGSNEHDSSYSDYHSYREWWTHYFYCMYPLCFSLICLL